MPTGALHRQALPCWPSAPSLLLQVSGHDSLTVQSLLTQTGELPNTRWLDRCANPLARPLLQAWAWSPRWSKGGEWGAFTSLLFPSYPTTTDTWCMLSWPKNGNRIALSLSPPAHPILGGIKLSRQSVATTNAMLLLNRLDVRQA